jgi:hypothetical protein
LLFCGMLCRKKINPMKLIICLRFIEF